ncbi:MAG: phosphatase domain-containing protein [Myxococcota bacterium]|nr:phosphatase domain-containing protein [Myxococcota bacterium]
MAQEEAPVRHIFRWDLDKTYLRTEFDSVRDLIRTALQKPEEKINVPGADGLLRELTRPDEAGRSVLTFISGSPEQMRRTLEQKFELDGVRPDAFILKPQLRLLLKGKFRAIRGQIGYKLDALLRVRGMTPLGPETLFGDDAEQDAFIYSLYGDLVGDRIDIDTLTEILQAANVYPDTRDLILERARTTPRQDTVTRIFINLDRRSAPGRFLPFGPRVIPITNYFQAALVLMRDSVLSPAGLVRMASGMVRTAGYGIPELANSFQDMGRRGLLGAEVVEMLEDARDGFEDLEDVPRDFPERLLSRLRALSPRSDLPERDWEGPPDYLEILEADREMRVAL